MKINEQVHLIRKEFDVTPDVKRYINIYLIVGKYCYLVDCGVAGTEKLIREYLASIQRDMTDIKAVILTHAHPDHVGAAAEIKRQTGCKLYAPLEEIAWIEDVQKQFRERPIPNFFQLFSESAKIDHPLLDGDIIELEDGIRLRALSTQGHSHGSMSYVLNDAVIFTGDAIPVINDLPIFVDYKETMNSLDKIQDLNGIKFYCPAWDEVYAQNTFPDVVQNSRAMLLNLREAVQQVDRDLPNHSDAEKLTAILQRADMLQYAGNPLVARSIEAIRMASL